MSSDGSKMIQRITKAEIEALQKKAPGSSEEVILSYLYAKAHGKQTDLEIESYPNGPSYVSLKRESSILDPLLKAWECGDGSFLLVRGEGKPDGAVADRSDYLNDNVYRDTVALRCGHLSELQSMYGDLTTLFNGSGRTGSMMSSISEKHQQVYALWKTDRPIGCVGVLGALTFLIGLFFVLIVAAHYR